MYMRTGYIHQVVSIPFAGNDWCYHCHWNMLSYLLSFSAIKSWILNLENLESQLNAWLQYIAQRQLQDEMRTIKVLGFGATYFKGLVVYTGRRWPQSIVSDGMIIKIIAFNSLSFKFTYTISYDKHKIILIPFHLILSVILSVTGTIYNHYHT